MRAVAIPYIKSNDGRREALQAGQVALNGAELNYQIAYHSKKAFVKKDEWLKENIYSIIQHFVDQFLGESPNYAKYNEMTGALVRCGIELVRRYDLNMEVNFLVELLESYDDVIGIYEEKKILENGDLE